MRGGKLLGQVGRWARFPIERRLSFCAVRPDSLDGLVIHAYRGANDVAGTSTLPAAAGRFVRSSRRRQTATGEVSHGDDDHAISRHVPVRIGTSLCWPPRAVLEPAGKIRRQRLAFPPQLPRDQFQAVPCGSDLRRTVQEIVEQRAAQFCRPQLIQPAQPLVRGVAVGFAALVNDAPSDLDSVFEGGLIHGAVPRPWPGRRSGTRPTAP